MINCFPFVEIISHLYLGLPGLPGPAGPAGNIEFFIFFYRYLQTYLFISGMPGDKGGIGEKGFPGDETYGIFVVSFYINN